MCATNPRARSTSMHPVMRPMLSNVGIFCWCRTGQLYLSLCMYAYEQTQGSPNADRDAYTGSATDDIRWQQCSLAPDIWHTICVETIGIKFQVITATGFRAHLRAKGEKTFRGVCLAAGSRRRMPGCQSLTGMRRGWFSLLPEAQELISGVGSTHQVAKVLPWLVGMGPSSSGFLRKNAVSKPGEPDRRNVFCYKSFPGVELVDCMHSLAKLQVVSEWCTACRRYVKNDSNFYSGYCGACWQKWNTKAGPTQQLTTFIMPAARHRQAAESISFIWWMIDILSIWNCMCCSHLL